MKHWKIDYSVKDNESGEIVELYTIVKSYTIIDAVKAGANALVKPEYMSDNVDMVIWCVDIIEENVF